MLVGLIGIIPSLVIFLFLSFSVSKQNYNLYKYAFYISIIYGFVLTILWIIGINIVSKLNADEDEDEDEDDTYKYDDIDIGWIKTPAYIFYPLAIILDLLLIGIIFCYKK